MKDCRTCGAAGFAWRTLEQDTCRPCGGTGRIGETPEEIAALREEALGYAVNESTAVAEMWAVSQHHDDDPC